MLKEQKSSLPKCLKTDQITLNSLKSLFGVHKEDEVLFALQPKILFSGKKQGMVFTKRAFYFFDKGEPTFISYYRLGNVNFKSSPGHVLFNFKNTKYIYDVQFGPETASFMLFISTFRKALNIIHTDDILSGLFDKNKGKR